MKTPRLSTLHQLARLNGIETEFVDSDGTTRRATTETVQAILRALGREVDSERAAEDSLRAAKAAASSTILEPVVVSRSTSPITVPVNLAQGLESEDATVTIELERGASRRTSMARLLSPVAGTPPTCLDFSRAGWDDIEPGVHSLMIESPRHTVRTWLILAPSCPLPDRRWGAFMPLHAVRSAGDWGIGSYTDLARLAEWVGARGGGFLGTLPLYPIDSRSPIDPSPYLPLSRLAYNELFIDPLAIPELSSSDAARRLLDQSTVARELEELRGQPIVDYDRVWSLKSAVLTLLYDEIHHHTRRLANLHAFAAAQPELRDYAQHQALVRRSDPAGNGAVELDPLFHLYLQWVAAQQLDAAGRAGAPLYADLPVGVRSDGFDTAWAADCFVAGVQGGAPPDAFFSSGQAWGFRPLHPETMRRDGYRYLRACLRRACAHASFLRLDHIAGLHRLYWIPEGMHATEGAYVRLHSDELRALVCLEAWRSETVVVGEDLGTVPAAVRPAMGEDSMLRSWVFEFESSEQDPLPAPPVHSMASLSTHDLPRFDTFLDGSDLSGVHHEGADGAASAERKRWQIALGLALGPSTERDGLLSGITARCLEHLSGGPADLVMVDLEELWGSRTAQNRPGTGPEAGNWRLRAEHRLEDMETDDERNAFLASLGEWRRGRPSRSATEEVAAEC
ncbi:MAG: 4-alpha-glucanotransferase [Acidimicrobiales bacterium]